MQSPPRVTVYWLDINTVSAGWEDVADAKASQPSNCETTGYLVQDDETKLVVCANWGHDDGVNEQTNLRTCIPRGCVVRVEHLTERRS